MKSLISLKIWSILLLTILSIDGHRVIYRFGGNYPTDRCRILLQKSPDGQYGSTQQTAMVEEQSRLVINHLNCSAVYSETIEPGTLVAPRNTTYNGVIGMLQRDEVDIVTILTRVDNLVDGSVVKVGSAIASGHNVMQSPIRRPTKMSIEISHVFMEVDTFTYVIFIVCITTIGIGLVLVHVVHYSRRMSLSKLGRKMAKTIWTMTTILIDNGDISRVSRSTPRILWTLMMILVFVTVFSYTLNYLACDQVADIIPTQLDTLYQLLNEQPFNKYQIYMSPIYFFYSIIKMAPNGSIYNRLYRRIVDTNGFIKYGFTESWNSKESDQLWSRFHKSRDMVLFLPGETVTMFKPIVCLFEPFKILDSHFGSEKISESIVAAPVNHRMSYDMYRYIRYRQMTVLEMGYMHQSVQMAIKSMVEGLAIIGPGDGQKLQCLYSLKDDQEPIVNVSSPISSYKAILELCFTIAMFGVIGLVIELVISRKMVLIN